MTNLKTTLVVAILMANLLGVDSMVGMLPWLKNYGHYQAEDTTTQEPPAGDLGMTFGTFGRSTKEFFDVYENLNQLWKKQLKNMQKAAEKIHQKSDLMSVLAAERAEKPRNGAMDKWRKYLHKMEKYHGIEKNRKI